MGFQGLRSPKNRSLLDVNEDFEGKRNTEITLLDDFLGWGGNVNIQNNTKKAVNLLTACVILSG